MMCKGLIFGCIAAVILMTAAYGAPFTTVTSPSTKAQYLGAAILDLEQVKHIRNNYLDLYTPTDKQECNQTTLQCFLAELEVLIADNEGNVKSHLRNIKKNLEVLQVRNSTEPMCKECKMNERKKFPEFHQELVSFLQYMQK
ncbi:IL15 protein, partial [Pomatostomus ruficeps]|nr:IL15 protein [Pomatostomus ruficeps]